MIRILTTGLLGAFTWVILCLTGTISAGEREEVAKIASRYGLLAEVRQADSTRVDLLSEEYAIEADWSEKWAEAIGQSLYYGEMTERKPGILLIRKTETPPELHSVYLNRCLTVCNKHDITIWEATEGITTVTRFHPRDPFISERQ